MEALLAGTWPDKNHLGASPEDVHGSYRFNSIGKPLCPWEPQLRAAFIGVKADLQFEKVTFRFETYDQLKMCRECKAHKTDVNKLYTEVGATASWRSAPRTQAEYLARVQVGDSLIAGRASNH